MTDFLGARSWFDRGDSESFDLCNNRVDTELREELRVLWLEYAQDDPKHLSKEARKLRKELRARLERIP